jgi:hypothetical protein
MEGDRNGDQGQGGSDSEYLRMMRKLPDRRYRKEL